MHELYPERHRPRMVEQGIGKATQEPKTMREVIFEGLQWYGSPPEIPATPQKKGKKKG
jgi:hypothetical protein